MILDRGDSKSQKSKSAMLSSIKIFYIFKSEGDTVYAKDVLEKLGVSVMDNQGGFKKLETIIYELCDIMNDLSQEEIEKALIK